jgi:hypothetical protein
MTITSGFHSVHQSLIPLFLYLNTTWILYHGKMALRYELPYFFDDATGRLSGSTFVEFHERMRINYIKRVDNESQSEYDIYKHSNEAEDQDGPAATLYFGPNHTLGTIQYRNQEPKNMDQYLSMVNISEGQVVTSSGSLIR